MALRTSQLTMSRLRPFFPTGTPLRQSCSPIYITSRYLTSSSLPLHLRAHPGVVVVPHKHAYVIERLGKFHKVLESGMHFLLPAMDRVAYTHSLKETAITIPNQTAITKDNVTIQIDGILYVKVHDPYDASYGVEDPMFAVRQLAQTTMRSELGKLSLDSTFLERESLNAAIVKAINGASKDWGLTCLRYEIRDISPPPNIRHAMEKQAEAERRKRAEILQSEGERESEINLATGRREGSILKAQGDAEGIRERARATAEGIIMVSASLSQPGALEAVSLQVAEQYIQAFSNVAKSGNTMIIPINAGDVASTAAQAMSIYKGITTAMKVPAVEGSENN